MEATTKAIESFYRTLNQGDTINAIGQLDGIECQDNIPASKRDSLKTKLISLAPEFLNKEVQYSKILRVIRIIDSIVKFPEENSEIDSTRKKILEKIDLKLQEKENNFEAVIDLIIHAANIDLANQSEDRDKIIKLIDDAAVFFKGQKSYKEVISLTKVLLLYSKSPSKHLINAHETIAYAYEKLDDLKKAKTHYLKAAEQAIMTGSNSLESLDVFQKLLEIQTNTGDYNGAIETAKTMLKHEQIKKNQLQTGFIYKQIASMYVKKRNKDLAIFNFKKSLGIYKEIGNTELQLDVTQIYIDSLLAFGQYPEAELLIEEERDLTNKLNAQRDQAKLLQHEGEIEYHHKKNLEEALNKFQKALEPDSEDPIIEIELNQTIGEIYNKQKQYDLALDFLDKALKKIEETGYKILEPNVKFNQAIIFKAKGNLFHAINLLKSIIETRDKTEVSQHNLSIVAKTLVQYFEELGNSSKAQEYRHLLEELR